MCVIIPAAGASRRFGSSDSSARDAESRGGGGHEKLGQDLCGRAVLIRTVELFARRDEVRSIIVAGPPEPEETWNAFRERYAPTLSFHGAQVVKGGSVARWETVRNALGFVPDDATHIAVHDAARPGTPSELLDRVFDAAIRFPAVIPGLPVTATLKRVCPDQSVEPPGGPPGGAADEDDALADLILGDAGITVVRIQRVIETIDRTDVVEAQTPQVFEADLLRRAYAIDDFTGVTDDASLVERLGEPVEVVPGDPRNFKITTIADLTLMRQVLGDTGVAEPEARGTMSRRGDSDWLDD